MKQNKYMRKIKRSFHKTRKNKLMALLLLGVGIVSAMVDGDATFLVLAIVFAAGLFFAKQNWIY